MNAPWTGGSESGSDRPSVDGDFTIPAAVGPIHISFPFEHDSHQPSVDSFIFDPGLAILAGYYHYAPDSTQNNSRLESFFIEQEFEQAADYFDGLALDTAYDQLTYAPDYVGSLLLSEAILVGESNPVSSGNGLVRWTRTYCRMPGLTGDIGYFSRNEYEQVPFTFPGITATTAFQLTIESSLRKKYGDAFVLGDGSDPLSTCVNARVQYDYFLVPVGGFSPNREDNTLPNYQHSPFQVWGLSGKNITENVTDPPFFAEGTWNDLSNNPVAVPFTCTNPPKTDQEDGTIGYLTAIDNGWEICVRASDIKQWRGNIFVRVTWFAAAQ
jgi:hypothetical protein